MSDINKGHIIMKRSTISGVVPTIPIVDDNRSATWIKETDIFSGELFINLADERIWFRGTQSIHEILFTGTNSTFLSLTDTPLTFAGATGYGVRVNSSANALEFYQIGSGTFSVNIQGETLGYPLDSSYFISSTFSETISPIQVINDGATGSNDLWSGQFISGTISSIVANSIQLAGSTGSIQVNSGSGTFSSGTTGYYESDTNSWNFSIEGNNYSDNSFNIGFRNQIGRYSDRIKGTDGTGTYFIIQDDVTSYWSPGDDILLIKDIAYTNEYLTIDSITFSGTASETYITPTTTFTDDSAIFLVNLTTAIIPSIGYITSLGYNNMITNNSSFAMGGGNLNRGIASGTLGGYNDIGYGAFGPAVCSFTIGQFNKINTDYGLATGYRNEVNGQYGDAGNSYNHADGENSFVRGSYNWASGINSAVFGIYSTASNDGAIAIGQGCIASAIYALATGLNSHSNGAASFTSGIETFADGDYSHAEGESTIASGYGAHAEGSGSEAQGDYSHAQNNTTIASGYSSHSEGTNTLSSGESSHAEGSGTIASGESSHAEGNTTSATASCSHAQGKESLATNPSESAISSGLVGTKLSQKSEFTMGCVIVGATESIAKINYDGTPIDFTPRTDSSYIMLVESVFRDENGASGYIAKTTCLFKNIGGTNSYIGSGTGATTSSAGANCDAPFDTSGDMKFNFSIVGNVPTFTYTSLEATTVYVTGYVTSIEIAS